MYFVFFLFRPADTHADNVRVFARGWVGWRAARTANLRGFRFE